MSDEDRRLDEALGPGVDPVRWEAAVRSIVAAAGPELERRARAYSPLIVLAQWTRPVLSAAATVALLASAAILTRGGSGGDGVEVATTTGEVAPEMAIASALLPGAMSTWIMGGETESVVALVQALEEGR